MFPDLPEGSLDAYRQALVQNQHLAELALVSFAFGTNAIIVEAIYLI